MKAPAGPSDSAHNADQSLWILIAWQPWRIHKYIDKNLDYERFLFYSAAPVLLTRNRRVFDTVLSRLGHSAPEDLSNLSERSLRVLKDITRSLRELDAERARQSPSDGSRRPDARQSSAMTQDV